MLQYLKKYPLFVFAALLFAACTHYKVQKAEPQHVVIEQTIAADSQIIKLIQPYKTPLDAKMNEVIGFAPEALVKKFPECNLGNFFADALYLRAKEIPGTDTTHLVAMFNAGGLRTSVPEGDIHVRNMFELMPFENELVLLPLKGSQLVLVLNAIADKGGAPLAGVRFKIVGQKAENIFVHQAVLDTNVVYTIATSDYLANGGDKFFNVNAPQNFTKTNLLLRDVLIEYCKDLYRQKKPVTGNIDGRISKAK
ncbi:MAG TPA: 5'-nucleotidase C-terminal domain-containing protein [Bacteroidia bacterium]|nr:5'-nucleotidase C-terminal domain-containing protein [Bacteroidia bacterium]